MKCQNCNKNESTIKYTEIINGEKKQYTLCEECAEKLGINDKMKFNMSMNLGNFFGGFFDDYNSNKALLNNIKELKCEKCGMTYNDFINEGKFGCDNCYNIFSRRLDGVLKNLQGDNLHKGRKIKKYKKALDNNIKIENSKENKKELKIKQLQKNLTDAIKEERYEDAAKIRDEIKNIDKE